MDIQAEMKQKAEAAKRAAARLALLSTDVKNKALLAMADALEKRSEVILQANELDLEDARQKKVKRSYLDRLLLDEGRIASMAEGLRQTAALPDPVATGDYSTVRPNGLEIRRVRVPLGVIGIIYEARPNVTADAAALCLKAGNAVILRGGSEAIHSNRAIAACIQLGLAEAGLPAACVQVVETTDRAAVGALIAMPEFVDVIVPRGGKGLISRLLAEARVPMIQHLDGNCHVYVETDADPAKALKIVENAKTQRYGTCNTAESLLVARSVAAAQLPAIAAMLTGKGVEIRGCAETQALVPNAVAATEEDYYTEFLAPIISVKVVAGIDEAIAHINQYSSHHSEAIVTDNHPKAMRFLREVDSSSVMVNASTRFADGFEYGLGAEIGISTDKFHARGPVGIEGRTSLKYVVLGEGEVRR